MRPYGRPGSPAPPCLPWKGRWPPVGRWSGFSIGHPPDFTKCSNSVQILSTFSRRPGGIITPWSGTTDFPPFSFFSLSQITQETQARPCGGLAFSCPPRGIRPPCSTGLRLHKDFIKISKNRQVFPRRLWYPISTAEPRQNELRAGEGAAGQPAPRLRNPTARSHTALQAVGGQTKHPMERAPCSHRLQARRGQNPQRACFVPPGRPPPRGRQKGAHIGAPLRQAW